MKKTKEVMKKGGKAKKIKKINKKKELKTKKILKRRTMPRKTNKINKEKIGLEAVKEINNEELGEVDELLDKKAIAQEPTIEEPGKEAWREQQKQKKVYRGVLLENKVLIFDKSDAEEVYDLGCFGKIKDDNNELSLEESLLLVKRNKLKVFKDEQEMNAEDFYKYACSADAEFLWKYIVYEDLRGRGLLVRTGFKFGTHFRVYARGVKLKRGPKSLKEHTKWIVHCIPENYTCSFPELSRAVRLAHNIRAKMLWAVVDEEGDATYYEIMRKTP